MRPAAVLLSLALVSLGGCTTEQIEASRAESDCFVLFRNYDQAVQVFGNSVPDGHREFGWKIPAAVDRAGQRMRENGCLTSDEDLAVTYLLDDDLRGKRIVESGAPIAPISLHAGIVQGITSEVQARQYFGGAGVRVRSQGAPGLGRHIYVGPFTTEGGLAQASEMALRGGFVAPYPARF